MTSHPLFPTILRALAVLIAVAGVADPMITSSRATRPIVAIVGGGDARETARIAHVARELGRGFTAITAPYPAADATIFVGESPPTTEIGAPVFAVVADTARPAVWIESLRTPATAPLDARVPVRVLTHVQGARGRAIDVTLRDGALLVDHVVDTLADDDAYLATTVAFTPTAIGTATLRVAVALAGATNSAEMASADALIEVRSRPWSILSYDPRPSWLATFVRRALQADPRFSVTSRTVTSREISIDAGSPPGRLDDLVALDLFDAVVVGAPEALSERDVTGLEAFMRRRGGSVVLLLDRRDDGPYRRLLGVGAWRGDSSGRITRLTAVDGDTLDLRASEIVWPAPLPPGASPVALAQGTARDTAERLPVIWRSPVGAGEVIVSGALDAWRFRDPRTSAFDPFWRTVVAQAASTTFPPLSVDLSRAIVAPGETVEIDAALRDIALAFADTAAAQLSATLAAVADTSAGPTMVRLWPTNAPGMFHGSFRAPSRTGAYRVTVSAAGQRVTLPVVVRDGTHHPTPVDRALLAAWVTGRGGRLVPESEVADLPNLLRAALVPARRPEQWHPLRSPWWIVPFALALAGEWWFRRRRGLP